MIKTVLKVEGMMCGMCESHMNDMIRNEFSVKKVKSSAKKGETVIISEEPLEKKKLREQIEKMGYHLLDEKTENYEKKFSFFGR